MTILSVIDASRMAGVSRAAMDKKITDGDISCTDKGVDVGELIRVYPNLQPLANLKLREVKQSPSAHHTAEKSKVRQVDVDLDKSSEKPIGTVELLVRELEWNKELLEKTNQQMAKQLAEQRAMIADQARRLDDKDRFWARQIEISQSLLAAPAMPKRKKIFGIF